MTVVSLSMLVMEMRGDDTGGEINPDPSKDMSLDPARV